MLALKLLLLARMLMRQLSRLRQMFSYCSLVTLHLALFELLDLLVMLALNCPGLLQITVLNILALVVAGMVCLPLDVLALELLDCGGFVALEIPQVILM